MRGDVLTGAYRSDGACGVMQGGGQQQQQQVQAMNPVQAAMLQMGGLIGAQPSAGPPSGGMAPGFAQFGIVPLAQLQGGGGQGGVQAMPLAGLTLLAPQVGSKQADNLC